MYTVEKVGPYYEVVSPEGYKVANEVDGLIANRIADVLNAEHLRLNTPPERTTTVHDVVQRSLMHLLYGSLAPEQVELSNALRYVKNHKHGKRSNYMQLEISRDNQE